MPRHGHARRRRRASPWRRSQRPERGTPPTARAQELDAWILLLLWSPPFRGAAFRPLDVWDKAGADTFLSRAVSDVWLGRGRRARLLPATGLVAISRVFRALSASAVVRPLLDEPANPLVLSERQRAPVALPRFVAAAEPTKQIGASKVERRVLLQGAATLDALEQFQGLDRADREGDGHGPIQLDDGRAFVPQQLIVQDGNLAPIRVRRGRCFRMDRRDRTLDLVGAGPPHAERLLDEPNALLDLGSLPSRPILILEQHEIALVADARLAP